MPEPIVFKCEDSLWRMLESGERRFEMRRWDLSDERIYRLAWGMGAHQKTWEAQATRRRGGQIRADTVLDGAWEPVEKQVSFLNKADGRLLTFEYLGLKFAAWAPGWCFLLLGRELRDSVPIED